MGWKPLLFCFALIVGHLFYTVWFPSIVNGERFYLSSGDFVSPEYIASFHESRSIFPEFARRPITTFLIDTVESIGVPTSKAFLLIEYAGLGLCLLLLFRLSLMMTGSEVAARWSVVLFITQFWALHAFFAQIYAYDEPWQYVFLILMLEMLHRQRWWLSGLFLLLSMIARESSLLLVPGLVTAFFWKRPFVRISNVLAILPVIVACLLYVGFLGYWISSHNLIEETINYSQGERWEHYRFSFAQWDIAIDTLMSLILSFVLPFTLIYLSKIKLESETRWRNAFWISFAINVPITLLFTMGREARIIAQPIIFLSPFFGYHFIGVMKALYQRFSSRKHHKMHVRGILEIVLLIISLYAASLIALELYWPTDNMFFKGFQLYAYFTFVLSILIIVISNSRISSWVDTTQNFIALGLVLVAAFILAGNQRGYKFFDDYSQLVKASCSCEEGALAVVNTNMPDLVERYFNDLGEKVIAGNFNHDDDYLKFLDQSLECSSNCLVYSELAPLYDVSMRYELYHRFGTKADRLISEDFPIIKYEREEGISDSEFSLVIKNKDLGHELDAEYGLIFKAQLIDLRIDTLYSIGAWVSFSDDSIPERATLVLSVTRNGETILWKGAKLKSIPIISQHDNRAWLSARLPNLTDTSIEVAAYVWNPDQKPLKYGNLHIDINTPWVQPFPIRHNVLGSRNLR